MTAFMDKNPEAVTGIMDENNVTDVYDGSDDIERISFDRVKYNRKMNRPDGAGTSWTEQEDTQLDDEYNSGMKISEIVRAHDRTNGAIRARLKKTWTY